MKLAVYLRRKKRIKLFKKITITTLSIAIPMSLLTLNGNNLDFGGITSTAKSVLGDVALYSAVLTMPEGGIRAIQVTGGLSKDDWSEMLQDETDEIKLDITPFNPQNNGGSILDFVEDKSPPSTTTPIIKNPQDNAEQDPPTTPPSNNLYIRQNISDYKSTLDYVAIGNKSGTIKTQTFTAGAGTSYVKLPNGGFIRNLTEHAGTEILAEVAKAPGFKIKKNDGPQVLIMHTHATESYEPYARSYFDSQFPDRNRDSSKNVVAVGDAIAKELQAAGIGVIQDGTLHDYPNYTGSYEQSAKTVKAYLEKYPSIKVVLDVHRDAIEKPGVSRTAPTTTINGKQAAQVMIISGCDDGTMNMPNYMQNLRFSALLQSKMETLYPTLTRAVLFDYRKYNQDLTTGSILIEVGGHANSLDQALYSGTLVGKSLVSALNTLV